ncbi:MAG: hypothetical protein ACI9T7_002325 [Oleiphilaceae bacterium]|jgi:CBS domain containing-hemolysin-like protein
MKKQYFHSTDLLIVPSDVIQSVPSDVHLDVPSTYKEITLESSAINVFIDFEKMKPLVVMGKFLAQEIESRLRISNSDLGLVIDSHGKFDGVIDLNNFSNKEFAKKIFDGYARKSIKVLDLIRRKKDLKTIYINMLNAISVREIINLFSEIDYKFCLVIDQNNLEIKGVIFALSLMQKLAITIL